VLPPVVERVFSCGAEETLFVVELFVERIAFLDFVVLAAHKLASIPSEAGSVEIGIDVEDLANQNGCLVESPSADEVFGLFFGEDREAIALWPLRRHSGRHFRQVILVCSR